MRPKWEKALTCLIISLIYSAPANSQHLIAKWRNDENFALVQLRMKPPKCGDHLQGSEAMPLSQIPLEFQILYEEDSGNECFRQGNNAMACDHYRRALAMLNSEYPYQADIRAIVQAIVNRCR
jgi:hypothetical protein